MARRRNLQPQDPRWSRRRMLALLVAAGLVVIVVVAGTVLAVVRAIHPTAERSVADLSGPTTLDAPPPSASSEEDARDELAARPMPVVDESASRPGPVSTRDPGPGIVVPPATTIGAAGVPTGFPRTPEGALAQLAAIDQTAFQSGSLAGARDVIRSWAAPGGPTTTTWSVVQALGMLLERAGLSGGGSPRLAIVLTPLMGLIKGTVGPDFVVPCVDFELDVTLQQTARGAVADCQRMVWEIDRWLIAAGDEPAVPPSVWPDTDLAISVGYRDLSRG